MRVFSSLSVFALVLSGCAPAPSAPSGPSKYDMILVQSKNAIIKANSIQLDAFGCAIEYSDANWKAALPSDIGVAALMECSSKEAEFAAQKTISIRNMEILSTPGGNSYNPSKVQSMVGVEVDRFRNEIVNAATGRAVQNKIKAAKIEAQP